MRSGPATWLCWMIFAVGAGAFPPQARSAEFSALIVRRDGTGSALGTAAAIHVSNNMVRIETPEAANGFFLTDADKGIALFVIPKQRVFMDARQSSFLTQLFVPMNADDPCGQWRAAADIAIGHRSSDNWRCERTDEKGADGGHAFGFRVSGPDGGSSLRWIDSDLKFPVKLLAADGSTLSLEQVRLEAQPADLFIVPPGFRRFDPQALLERIKHSDAWVDP